MKYRNRKLKKQRRIIIISVVCLAFAMVTAYSAFSTKLSIGAKGTVIDRSRTIQSWSNTSNEDFHTDFYRENIVSATFLDSAKVPSNKVESWDVSVDKDGGVMAYVVESPSETGKYDLFIGAKDGVIANEDSSSLFYQFTSLTNINFNNNFDTSNTINMAIMFAYCKEIISLDLSSFDTRNVINMKSMFVGNPMKIETIIFGDKFVTSNVTNMHAMFGNCNNLKNLDVSKFDTSNVTNMYDVFASCKSLTNIDVSNWDTRKVTTMHGMFYNCPNLTNLDLCSFDTSNVTDMNVMFSSSKNLTKIKVGPNWNTSNATTTDMFSSSGVSSVTTGEC